MHNTKVSYFLGAQLLGQSETFSASASVHSQAFFCTTCGEIWGRLAVEQEAMSQVWEITYSPCLKHKSQMALEWGHIPGSFLGGSFLARRVDSAIMHWAKAIDVMPVEVLRRELKLALNNQEQRNNDELTSTSSNPASTTN